MPTKADRAWQTICDALHIPETVDNDGIFHITSDQIKQISKEEPRLVCKFDFATQLPQVFRDNHIAIVPEARGTYAIGHFNLFHDIHYPEDVQVRRVDIHRKFDTLDISQGFHHETSAVMASHIYGIFNRLNDEPMTFTRFGRTSGGEFEYNIGGQHINGESTQLEMDGCFEGDTSILSLEAKIDTHETFCIRQLYYPMRYLMQLSEKSITNVFLTAAGGSVYTHVFDFEDTMDYNSINLRQVIRHDFFDPFPEATVGEIITDTPAEPEDENLIFPQSDSMSKVFTAIEMLAQKGPMTDAQIADELGTTYRQGGYYANAVRYLGLTNRVRNGRPYENSLSDLGQTFIQANTETKNRILIRQMCKHGIFRNWLQVAVDGGDVDASKIERDIIATRQDLGDGTPDRRARTVKAWVEWVRSITM